MISLMPAYGCSTSGSALSGEVQEGGQSVWPWLHCNNNFSSQTTPACTELEVAHCTNTSGDDYTLTPTVMKIIKRNTWKMVFQTVFRVVHSHVQCQSHSWQYICHKL